MPVTRSSTGNSRPRKLEEAMVPNDSAGPANGAAAAKKAGAKANTSKPRATHDKKDKVASGRVSKAKAPKSAAAAASKPAKGKRAAPKKATKADADNAVDEDADLNASEDDADADVPDAKPAPKKVRCCSLLYSAALPACAHSADASLSRLAHDTLLTRDAGRRQGREEGRHAQDQGHGGYGQEGIGGARRSGRPRPPGVCLLVCSAVPFPFLSVSPGLD